MFSRVIEHCKVPSKTIAQPSRSHVCRIKKVMYREYESVFVRPRINE